MDDQCLPIVEGSYVGKYTTRRILKLDMSGIRHKGNNLRMEQRFRRFAVRRLGFRGGQNLCIQTRGSGRLGKDRDFCTVLLMFLNHLLLLCREGGKRRNNYALIRGQVFWANAARIFEVAQDAVFCKKVQARGNTTPGTAGESTQCLTYLR